jgi:peptidoglycan/xylan/chitin deacetylase (PgdA/CDA1 family)
VPLREKSAGRLPAFEGRAMLSWPEMREMQRAGMEFGAHTLTHPDLTGLSDSEIAVEMSVSKAHRDRPGDGRHQLRIPVRPLRCPEPSHGPALLQLRVRRGLLSDRSDPYALARVDAYYLRTPRLFSLMATKVFPWYVVARNVPRRLRRALTPPVRA